MYLFCDTETSDPVNQRICQLAAVLCDEQGKEVAELNTLIKPDGWEVHPRFVDIHGITTQMCIEKGIPMPIALDMMFGMSEKFSKVICHNYKFDSARIAFELSTYGYESKQFLEIPYFCTMINLTNICCIPNPNGRAGYKWPKLKEAHKHFFGVEFADQHDALADVRACKRIYFEMHKPVIVASTIESAPAVVKESEFTSQGGI
jgi:DNA polymerase III subunit epsilon